MLKKINITDACQGMFVERICGDWMEHRFLKDAFLLSTQDDLEKLKKCGVTELMIDTDKGADIVQKSSKTVQSDQEQALNRSSTQKTKQSSLEEELQVAEKIYGKSKEAVKSMFDDVRMGKAVQVDEAMLLVDEINQSIHRNADAFLSLIKLKTVDEYTYMHSVAVSVLMMALGKQLGIQGDELRHVGVAGLLHDIGKMMVPFEVLHKPGKLSDQEFVIVKDHTRRGWEILKEVLPAGHPALDVCLHHHERMDGKGYPEGLSAENISLHARMGTVCDIYDALTSDRCYKKRWEPAKTIQKMATWNDGLFDEMVFHAFVKTIGIYPNGTLVKLKSGFLGVVIEQSISSLLTPVVKIFFSFDSNMRVPVEIVDLSNSIDRIVGVEDPQLWEDNLKMM